MTPSVNQSASSCPPVLFRSGICYEVANKHFEEHAD